MKNDSPCTDICQYDPLKKWCLGCGRAAEEIKSWKTLSPFRRTKLMADLKRRLSKLQQK